MNAAAVQQAPNRTYKVLVADDEPAVRALLQVVLDDPGRYELVVAADGEEALSLARAEAPDLVILDVQMPKMDGLEVCRRIRALPELARTHVMMLSAMARGADKSMARQAGADDYVTKPFSPKVLRQKVREAIAA
jgi:CheY-like chemotaxis protein